MKRVEDYIEKHAAECPDKTAIVCGTETCSYADLQQRVAERARVLKAQHPHGGAIVCLRAVPGVDYFIDYFALHKAGCVAVPLEKDLPDGKLEETARELTAHQAPEGAADILYTTGTTGKSKGVVISHRTILADAENLIEGQGFSEELAFVVNGPLNHIGSLSKVWPVIMVGGTLMVVDGLKDMEQFFDAFSYPAPKMATFLVPASIRILLQLGADRLAALADKIDFIETGAAALAQSDMQRLCQLLPNSRLYNTYASTETGIISTYNFNDGHPTAGCLGRPMSHSRLLITDQGRIACQGDTLMSGYIGDAEKTAEILRDGTLYTNDLGYIDEQGMLHLTGREDDVINVGGFKVAPTEVEDAALSYPGVEDCVCIGIDHPITGKALQLLVVMADGLTLNKRQLALHLKSRLETYKVPQRYQQVEAVNRTFNGKINRKAYYIND